MAVSIIRDRRLRGTILIFSFSFYIESDSRLVVLMNKSD